MTVFLSFLLLFGQLASGDFGSAAAIVIFMLITSMLKD